jgi:hypothetical protein
VNIRSDDEEGVKDPTSFDFCCWIFELSAVPVGDVRVPPNAVSVGDAWSTIALSLDAPRGSSGARPNELVAAPRILSSVA